ncbi:MAG: hypothetical protein MUO97_01635 [Dehalococcoidia bacterium]|nr:hypothetical protein [Dehalococcoidia bacterium]
MVGDSVNITTPIKNVGDIAGTYTAVLSVDDQEAGSKTISVNPRGNQDISFQLSQATAGSHQVAIGSSSAVLTVHNWSPYTIQYDEAEGSPAGAYVNGEQGHIVHFTPPNKSFKIQKIRIFGATKIKDTSELKNHITVRIWDKDGNNQLWSQDFPWSLFLSGGWQDIKVPDVRVNDDFQVEVVTHSHAQGDPIDFALITGMDSTIGRNAEGKLLHFPGPASYAQSVVLIGAAYPPTYIEYPSPSLVNRPETRSGYSYMGKLIDPGQGRLERINWLIRVDGEGAPGN